MRSLSPHPHPSAAALTDTACADAASDVNWTRVGTELASRTISRPNLVGLYIDDFYVMMCTPEANTYVRHGSVTPLPCVPVAALDTTRRAMQAINPRIGFMPLVYHLQIPYIVPHSYVLGAGQGVAFLPPARAAVQMQVAAGAQQEDRTTTQLRFYYHSPLSAWSKDKPWAKPSAKPVAGLVQFEAAVNGQTVLSIDAVSACPNPLRSSCSL